MNHLNQNPYHSLCLTKVVQFLSLQILEQNALFLFRKFISLLTQQNGKVQILKGIAAIILSVEEQSDIFADEIIPHLQLLLQNQLWQVKKMALNILYSLVVLQKDKILEHYFFKDLINYQLRINWIKQIKDSANLILDVLYQDNYNYTSVERYNNYVCQNKSQSQTQIHISTTNKQQLSCTTISKQPQTPSQQQNNRLSQTNHTDEKLQLIIDAILFLSGILRLKGICDSIEIQQIDSILSRLNERDSYKQPILKFSQCADSESFISKEAAEILREFKEKQISEYLR